jgi:N-acetylmuramic acid 6-phosphate (MurNAc-6-P) etherase
VDGGRAAELLEGAGGRVKVAIVMARLSVSREEAEERLREAGGRISEALKNG